MPVLETIVLFMAAVLALNLTPGPDMLFCFANGLSRGRTAGVVAALGIGTGSLVHTLGAALGVAGLIAASPVLFDAVRYAGAAYLAWLAWKAFRAPPVMASPAGSAADKSRPAGPRLWRVYVQGCVTNVLNPKVALFFLAFVPQFVRPDAGPVPLQVLVFGALISVSGTIVNAAVGMSSGGLAGVLARNRKIARVQQWLTGTIFLALAVRLLLGDGRPHQGAAGPG